MEMNTNPYVEYTFEGHKYRIYQYGNTVIAVSTYGGKYVKGKAICSTSDKFNFDMGAKLACARCNVKIAAKRLANAEFRNNKMDEIVGRAMQAKQRYFQEAEQSYRDWQHAGVMVEELLGQE